MLHADGEPVEYREQNVLVSARFDNRIHNLVASCIVGLKVLDAMPVAECVLNVVGTLLGIEFFLWFRIAKQFTIYQTLAIANHPNLLSPLAIDDATGGSALLRMAPKLLEVEAIGYVGGMNRIGYSFTKSITGDVCRHVGDGILDDMHATLSVRHRWIDANGRFTGASVDDSHETAICEDAVLVGFLAFFPYGCLFDDGHKRAMMK
mgnify:CR=1 FL=1